MHVLVWTPFLINPKASSNPVVCVMEGETTIPTSQQLKWRQACRVGFEGLCLTCSSVPKVLYFSFSPSSSLSYCSQKTCSPVIQQAREHLLVLASSGLEGEASRAGVHEKNGHRLKIRMDTDTPQENAEWDLIYPSNQSLTSNSRFSQEVSNGVPKGPKVSSLWIDRDDVGSKYQSPQKAGHFCPCPA